MSHLSCGVIRYLLFLSKLAENFGQSMFWGFGDLSGGIVCNYTYVKGELSQNLVNDVDGISKMYNHMQKFGHL